MLRRAVRSVVARSTAVTSTIQPITTILPATLLVPTAAPSTSSTPSSRLISSLIRPTIVLRAEENVSTSSSIPEAQVVNDAPAAGETIYVQAMQIRILRALKDGALSRQELVRKVLLDPENQVYGQIVSLQQFRGELRQLRLQGKVRIAKVQLTSASGKVREMQKFCLTGKGVATLFTAETGVPIELAPLLKKNMLKQNARAVKVKDGNDASKIMAMMEQDYEKVIVP